MAVGNGMGIGIPMVNLGLGGGGGVVEERFIISVKTDKTGVSNDDQFQLPWQGQYDVEWGDGNKETVQSGTTTHTYATAGTYDVSVTPINNCRVVFSNGDKNKLLEIKNWGTGVWSSFGSAFFGCNFVDVTATDIPDLSVATNIGAMFRSCLLLVGNSSFANWDLSNVNRAENMFRNAALFNQNISSWDMSTITRTDQMFMDTDAFNQPLGSWNMGNVTTMNNMLRNLGTTFDQSLANWDITSLSTANNMFFGSTLSTASYDATLIGWAAQDITNAVSIGFGSSQFTSGGAAAVSYTHLTLPTIYSV